MKTKLLAAALIAAAIPTGAFAQRLPAATVGVVNSQQILEGCTVCRAADQQLAAQQQQLRQRAQTLGLVSATPNTPAPLEAEGQAIQAAIDALPPGQQANAALQARIQTFQTNMQNAQREIAAGEQTIRRNQAFLLQQIQQRVSPAVAQVGQQRGATVVLDASNIAWSSPTVDLTSAVLAVVNQNTTPLNVNAPPPQQQPQPAQQPQRPQQPPRADPNR